MFSPVPVESPIIKYRRHEKIIVDQGHVFLAVSGEEQPTGFGPVTELTTDFAAFVHLCGYGQGGVIYLTKDQNRELIAALQQVLEWQEAMEPQRVPFPPPPPSMEAGMPQPWGLISAAEFLPEEGESEND